MNSYLEWKIMKYLRHPIANLIHHHFVIYRKRIINQFEKVQIQNIWIQFIPFINYKPCYNCFINCIAKEINETIYYKPIVVNNTSFLMCDIYGSSANLK